MQRIPHRRLKRLARTGTFARRLGLLMLATALTGGCGGGGAAAPATPTTPPGGTVPTSLGMTPTDAEIAVGGQVRINATALDAAGNPLPGLPAPTFTSSDPTIARVEPDGLVTGVAVGRATIAASVAAGGVTRSAASTVTVSGPRSPPPQAPPSHAVVSTPDRSFNPGTVTIAAGGTVTWQMIEDRHDVTFIGAAPPEGSIPETPRGSAASRTFPTPGRYEYECSRHRDRGMRGTVIVEAADAGGEGPGPGPGSATVTTPGTSFDPRTVTIAAGETVTWQFSGARHNVFFRAAAPPGGNIPDTEPGNAVTRSFPSAGTYDYDCTRHAGMTGRVVVQ